MGLDHGLQGLRRKDETCNEEDFAKVFLGFSKVFAKERRDLRRRGFWPPAHGKRFFHGAVG